ncbi:DUF4004 family protein [Proteiniclasticum sp. SCR006]|uniref:DUF4004 family protein n=1 Tax=Proteiniclasticum aestuarii TaxID=2817862 RepID=A0A939KGR8_9CLOT|nr:DUF4004 family protein [Proteiniclasticum aestuarii]MBO1264719.1 DUF4004 family protein [Proteiniclasticum aestuarii]
MEELISKKDLLVEMSISYGQLYRWKRKKLIPEEWFMKKSTYTGQETFFPREKIMDRIHQILNMKDGASLDDLADKFSSDIPESMVRRREELLSLQILSKEIINLYEEIFKGKEEYSFEDILYMYISEDLLNQGHLSIEDMSRILRMLSDNYETIKDKDPSLSVYRKFGVSVSLLHKNGEIFYSDQTPIVDNYSIRSAVEKLKLKII